MSFVCLLVVSKCGHRQGRQGRQGRGGERGEREGRQGERERKAVVNEFTDFQYLKRSLMKNINAIGSGCSPGLVTATAPTSQYISNTALIK